MFIELIKNMFSWFNKKEKTEEIKPVEAKEKEIQDLNPFIVVGCGGGGVIEQIDATKTQIFVNHYDGGVGHEWLDSSDPNRKGIKQKFEELYKDYKGENGKVEPVTKQEILDFIGENKIQIEEVKYSQEVIDKDENKHRRYCYRRQLWQSSGFHPLRHLL